MGRRFRLGSCVVALMVVASCGRVSETPGPPEPADPKLARAVVTRDSATVTIPVGKRSVWQWNREGTAETYREYQWEVVAPGVGAFGFSLFKFGPPEEGKLEELLSRGQASLWEALPNSGGQLVKDASVQVRPAESDAAVEVVLSHQPSVEQLLSKRPATVEIFTRSPNAERQTYTVPVEYKDQ